MSRKMFYRAITLLVNMTLAVSQLTYTASQNTYFSDLRSSYSSEHVLKGNTAPEEFCFSEHRITPPTYAKAK